MNRFLTRSKSAAARRLRQAAGKEGLDHPIMEGGNGLSGGQRQSLLRWREYARSILCYLTNPLAGRAPGTRDSAVTSVATSNLVVATHRVPILELVERVVVLKKDNW